MTTSNIDGLDALLAQSATADNAVAQAVEVRAEALAAAVKEARTAFDRNESRAAIAARTRRQRYADTLSAADEEAGQLVGILQGNPAPAPTTDPDPVPNPAPASRVFLTLTMTEWALALVGAIIGFLVARFTWSPLFGDFATGWFVISSFVWTVILMGLGFFGFGAIGSVIDERRLRQNAQQQ